MKECAHILQNATNRSFVIMDEVGRGTSSVDGMSIAGGIVKYLETEIGCRTLFATHYHEITELFNESSKWRMRTISKPDGTCIMTHVIEPGVCKDSHGFHIAKIAGLPDKVLEFAEQYRSLKVK